MDLEFRDVHSTMLALPIEDKSRALTPADAELAKEYAESMFVTRGVVLAARTNRMRYTVVYGAEVVRAALSAQIEYIPCLIADTFTDRLIELVSTGIEEKSTPSSPQSVDIIAHAIEQYNLVEATQLSLRKAHSIANLGPRSTLHDEKRLAVHLIPAVQELVRNGSLNKSAGRSISYLRTTEQLEFAKKAITQEWTVREIDLARANRTASKTRETDAPYSAEFDGDIADLIRVLEDVTKGSVSITPKTKHTGTIIFELYGANQAAEFLTILAGLTSDLRYTLKGRHRQDAPKKDAITLSITYTNLRIFDELIAAITGK